jgi:DNA-binding response OmpR family regulator
MPRMLIVEDELDLAECLELFFRSRGFAVACAFSGEEALEQVVREGAPDVMLVDILLPGLSGMEVLKRVKALYPSTLIVMVTGVDQIEVRTEARLYGAAAYITKPFDFSDSTWSTVLVHPA